MRAERGRKMEAYTWNPLPGADGRVERRETTENVSAVPRTPRGIDRATRVAERRCTQRRRDQRYSGNCPVVGKYSF